MNLQQLLDGVEVVACNGETSVNGVQFDSRSVHPGDVFIAIKGETADGNSFIDPAIKGGAAAIITDSAQATPRMGVAWVVVTDGRRALARISANFYGHPEAKLAITGITGTNGKTTTSFLLESILTADGRKSALVGTIEYHLPGRVLPAPHTTPESLELEELFAEAVSSQATEVVMEVSSHALAQGRVYGIPFNVAVFTNLTRDHLDYHLSLPEYFAAKRLLFSGCGTEPPVWVVANIDDEHGQALAAFSKSRSQLLTYGLEQGDFHAARIAVGQNGTRFDLVTPNGAIPIWTPLVGKINVYNILAAVAAAYARGCPATAISKGIAALLRVPGRFEKVDMGQPFTVVVDYAHTDDALRNLTAIARDFVAGVESGGLGQRAQVITVFGCGGDRDRTKRPLMGEAAGRGSDLVVLTSDNPRSEDPVHIMNDALPGLQHTGTRYILEPDRRKAIEMAIDEARAGDIVLIAGKGHETKQVGLAGSMEFDDVEVARKALVRNGFDQSDRHPSPPKDRQAVLS
ncbi:MAG: UDP-N-acetylmuramoyl-L-alanyl-D-glutamate--2,6-diaminopimelate ligase [Terriglobales bacterium]|jgi:UDP-N-acetylmuramoyl-L-alanyl-D-glutamate--2,6-diaminopimelate ligase